MARYQYLGRCQYVHIFVSQSPYCSITDILFECSIFTLQISTFDQWSTCAYVLCTPSLAYGEYLMVPLARVQLVASGLYTQSYIAAFPTSISDCFVED